MISQKLLNELKLILKDDYNVSLKHEALEVFAENLVHFFRLLGKVNNQTSMEKYEYENQEFTSKE
jgi:hypothetical protein